MAMSSKAKYHSLFVTGFFIFCCLESVVEGAFLSVAMSPQDVKVNAGEWAMFTCSMSCNLTLTNTMNWFVGDSPSNKRRVDQNFQYRTGIMIKEIDISDCRGSEMERRELYIFASSVEKMNSTAVQCGATRKHPNIPDLYSHYGIIIVEDQSPPTTEPEVTTGRAHPEPSTTEPALVVTSTKTVTVTVTQSAQPTNIPQPESAPAKECPSKNGDSREASSLWITLSFAILSLFVLSSIY